MDGQVDRVRLSAGAPDDPAVQPVDVASPSPTSAVSGDMQLWVAHVWGGAHPSAVD